MTEKRFTTNYQDGEIVSVHDNGKTINIKQMVECLNNLHEENEQLKQVLGDILLEVRRDITNINVTGEIKVFINPNSYELISEVLRKFGALKEWYK